jgi:hypothetical protein
VLVFSKPVSMRSRMPAFPRPSGAALAATAVAAGAAAAAALLWISRRA